MNNPKIIIGFVGHICSGKGEAIKYLVEKHGFIATSNSDQIREEIKKRGQEITRENLAVTAGDLREKYGPGILAQRAWDKIKEQNFEKVIFDAIRTLGEVDFLKTLPNFHLIAIEADQKIRFERIKKRIIPGQTDPVTWEGFLAAEKRDLGHGMNIQDCIEIAEFSVTNEGTKDELYKQLDKILSNLPT